MGRYKLTTPRVRIVNAVNGFKIADNLSKDGVHVTYFRYSYKDEDPDECEIVLESGDYVALQNQKISYGTMLRVSWGYADNRLTQPLTVTVRDMETKYGSNTTIMRLTCTDLTSYLASVTGSISEELTILQYLRTKCLYNGNMTYRCVIKEDGVVVYKQGRDKIGEEEEVIINKEINDGGDPGEEGMNYPYDLTDPFQLALSKDNLHKAGEYYNVSGKQYFYRSPDTYYDLKRLEGVGELPIVTKKPEIPKNYYPDYPTFARESLFANMFTLTHDEIVGYEIKQKEETEIKEPEIDPLDSGGLSNRISAKFGEFLMKPRAWAEINRTPIQNIRDAFQGAPNGPWYVFGRGDTIVIHNRNTSRLIHKQYFYRSEKSDLIDVTIKSDHEEYDNNQITSGVHDAYHGNYLNSDIYLKSLIDMRPLKEILTDKNITKEEQLEELEAWDKGRKNYEKYRIASTKVKPFNTEVTRMEVNPKDAAPSIFSSFVNSELESQGVEYGLGSSSLVRKEKIFKDPYIIYTTPTFDEEEQKNMVRNKARELEMGKLKLSSSIFLGDISLVSEQVIYLGNLAPIHNGTYYLSSVDHVISNDGYKTMATGFRVRDSVGAMSTFMKSGLGTKEEDVGKSTEELWIIQENLFGGGKNKEGWYLKEGGDLSPMTSDMVDFKPSDTWSGYDDIIGDKTMKEVQKDWNDGNLLYAPNEHYSKKETLESTHNKLELDLDNLDRDINTIQAEDS